MLNDFDFDTFLQDGSAPDGTEIFGFDSGFPMEGDATIGATD